MGTEATHIAVTVGGEGLGAAVHEVAVAGMGDAGAHLHHHHHHTDLFPF